METLKISFNKEKLFNRVNVDILNRGEYTEQQSEMCEHDRAWFDVVLNEAAGTVTLELSRISKGIFAPLINTEESIIFEIENTDKGYINILPDSIERCLIVYIINQWFEEHIGTAIANYDKPLSYLKHVTLLIKGASRKPYY